MLFSKAEADRLGNKIRSEKDLISEGTLNQLQSYRTSHKDVLSNTFNMLCKTTRQVHPSAIVTYRIKRFESIIGKLQRYPDMRFSRMWDIGGCRCILRNNSEVYRLREIIKLEKNFEIVKEYDYIEAPQKTGYKSLHLFIKNKCDDKTIEVQLRNQADHNWATLVEITDLLFDYKLKELGNNEDLLRFHSLLSQVNNLCIEDKKEISRILQQYNYVEKLSAVFSRNYIDVRRQWFNIESRHKHNFFLIETTKDDVPKISSFKSSIEAEEAYFSVYKSRHNANIVLTHLQKPNYNQVSIAYSNYILTFHSFLDEFYDIIESLILDSIKNREYYQFYKVLTLYNILGFNHVKNFMSEIMEVQSYSQKKSRKHRDLKKENEWIKDLQRQITKINERSSKMKKQYSNNIPSSWLGRLIYTRVTKHVSNKYKRRIEKHIRLQNN